MTDFVVKCVTDFCIYAFIVCVYLLSKLFKYFWNKRKAFLETKSNYGFMESPSGLKILMPMKLVQPPTFQKNSHCHFVLLVHRGTAERLKSSQMPLAKAVRQAEVLPTGVISDISRHNREEKQRHRQLCEATIARAWASKEMVVKVTPQPYLSYNNLDWLG